MCESAYTCTCVLVCVYVLHVSAGGGLPDWGEIVPRCKARAASVDASAYKLTGGSGLWKQTDNGLGVVPPHSPPHTSNSASSCCKEAKTQLFHFFLHSATSHHCFLLQLIKEVHTKEQDERFQFSGGEMITRQPDMHNALRSAFISDHLDDSDQIMRLQMMGSKPALPGSYLLWL